MPWSPPPARAPGDGLELVTDALDSVLVPLGFAPGQVGTDGRRGQVTFCRGQTDSVDGGCVDLVLDVEATPEWRIVAVRYWGFPSERWRLDIDGSAVLATQLEHLARSLPDWLATGMLVSGAE